MSIVDLRIGVLYEKDRPDVNFKIIKKELEELVKCFPEGIVGVSKSKILDIKENRNYRTSSGNKYYHFIHIIGKEKTLPTDFGKKLEKYLKKEMAPNEKAILFTDKWLIITEKGRAFESITPACISGESHLFAAVSSLLVRENIDVFNKEWQDMIRLAVVHEIAELLGLRHCDNYCFMHPSGTGIGVLETFKLCKECENKLIEKYLTG